jgi:hypothetical protein
VPARALDPHVPQKPPSQDLAEPIDFRLRPGGQRDSAARLGAVSASAAQSAHQPFDQFRRRHLLARVRPQ